MVLQRQHRGAFVSSNFGKWCGQIGERGRSTGLVTLGPPLCVARWFQLGGLTEV